MAASSKKNKGLLLYNRILRELGNINKALPEERRISIEKRREIVSKQLYPAFKTQKGYIKKKDIVKAGESEYQKLPPVEECDPNYISPELYAIVDWFAIDEFIQTVMPQCINVKVNAAEWGITKIFNTRNYNYHKSGVKNIIENLREVAKENSQLDFSGYKKLKYNKPNDGTPDNYYIEFILNINGQPQGDTSIVKFKLPGKTRKTQGKVRDIILDRIKGLNAKKRKRKRARKTFITNITNLKKAKKKVKVLKTPAAKRKANVEKVKQFNKANAALERDFKNGLLTPDQFTRYKKELYDNFEMGGEIK